MGSLEINPIIDLERFPLDRPGHPAYQDLLQQGRQSLEEKALFGYDRDPGMVFDQAYVDELHDSMPG